MNTYIGIDLGTSSVKLLLVDAEGKILSSASEEYPIYRPYEGFSEQLPSDWLNAVIKGVKILLKDFDKKNVKGISFAGQMHGLVVLDENDQPIRPCILWNDGRTAKQTAYLNEVIGKKKLSSYVANIAFAGFTAPKILWIKENEPDNFDRIAKIMLPKDYLCYTFTGNFYTDYSDAAGTLLLDVKNRKWRKEMLDICGITENKLPLLKESFERAGKLKKEYAELFGLSQDVIVAVGAGDNAAAAIGTGTVNDGDCNISVGTSGTVFISEDKFSVDENNALHSFCHANGKYHLMGCILSAACCNKWWMNVLNTDDYSLEQANLDKLLSKNDVFFLPYLSGERSPHNDVFARGAFIGVSLETTRKNMTLAVMEGVAFALKDCVEVAKKIGVTITSSHICGGGAKSKLWLKIIANVLNIPLLIPSVEEGPAYGAFMLAAVACGEYRNVKEAASKLISVSEIIYPDEKLAKGYREKYIKFKKLYPALKGLF